MHKSQRSHLEVTALKCFAQARAQLGQEGRQRHGQRHHQEQLAHQRLGHQPMRHRLATAASHTGHVSFVTLKHSFSCTLGHEMCQASGHVGHAKGFLRLYSATSGSASSLAMQLSALTSNPVVMIHNTRLPTACTPEQNRFSR